MVHWQSEGGVACWFCKLYSHARRSPWPAAAPLWARCGGAARAAAPPPGPRAGPPWQAAAESGCVVGLRARQATHDSESCAQRLPTTPSSKRPTRARTHTPSSLQLVPVRGSEWVKPERYRRFTMICQAAGSVALGWEALKRRVPEVRARRRRRRQRSSRPMHAQKPTWQAIHCLPPHPTPISPPAPAPPAGRYGLTPPGGRSRSPSRAPRAAASHATCTTQQSAPTCSGGGRLCPL